MVNSNTQEKAKEDGKYVLRKNAIACLYYIKNKDKNYCLVQYIERVYRFICIIQYPVFPVQVFSSITN